MTIHRKDWPEVRKGTDKVPAERPMPSAWLLIAVSFGAALSLLLAVGLSGPLHLLRHPVAPSALGMTLSRSNRDGGVLVTSLQQAGPADRAGIEVGDRIVSIDAKPAQSAAAIGDEARAVAGDAVQLVVLHNGRQRRVELKKQGTDS